MIISCEKCDKKFELSDELIPNEGRDLQCGSCNHVWFYKIEEQNNEILKLNEEVVSKDIEITFLFIAILKRWLYFLFLDKFLFIIFKISDLNDFFLI